MDTTVLAAFLEYSPNPTWLADSDGRCVYANQELREITALSAAQLGDLNWLELVAEEDRQMSSTLWQEARIHHQPYRARFFLRVRVSARGSAVEAVGTGHIAFVNGATADYLGLPSDHPLRFAANFEAPWDAHLIFLHPEDQPTSSRKLGRTNSNGAPAR